MPLGPDHGERRLAVGAEAAGQLRQPVAREAQERAHLLVDLPEPRVPRLGGAQRDRLRRLVPEQVTGRIDAIDPDVAQRTAGVNALGARVVGRHLLREDRREEPGLADLAAAHELHRREVRLLEVEPIGDHQLDPAPLAGGDHPFGLGAAGGDRLFAQHVNARAGGALGEGGVQIVGDGDVDRVDRPASPGTRTADRRGARTRRRTSSSARAAWSASSEKSAVSWQPRALAKAGRIADWAKCPWPMTANRTGSAAARLVDAFFVVITPQRRVPTARGNDGNGRAALRSAGVRDNG